MANTVTMIYGNVGRDPEIKEISNGKLASFSVAVKIRKDTHWYNCKAFGHAAEFVANYVQKGRALNVVGKMRSNTWEDRNGSKRISWELVADSVSFAGPRPQNEERDERGEEFDPDNIPF